MCNLPRARCRTWGCSSTESQSVVSQLGENQWALIKLRKQVKSSGPSSTDTTAKHDQGPHQGPAGNLRQGRIQAPLPHHLITPLPVCGHTQAPPTPYLGSVGQEEHLNSNCVPHILSRPLQWEMQNQKFPLHHQAVWY